MAMKGRIALVTGGAQGIGRATCDALLSRGCKVCCCDVNIEKGNETVNQLREVYGNSNCTFVKCDVSSLEEFDEAFVKTNQALGKVNILVNNAGVSKGKILEINLIGTINGCSIAYKYMGKHNGGEGGAVINLASVAAFMAFPYNPVYAATKAAVVSITRSYGHEFHYDQSGIKFMALSPAAVNTEMLKQSNGSFNEQFRERIKKYSLMEPSSVAESIIQLLEDERNGATMVLVGGKGSKYVTFPDVEN